MENNLEPRIIDFDKYVDINTMDAKLSGIDFFNEYNRFYDI